MPNMKAIDWTMVFLFLAGAIAIAATVEVAVVLWAIHQLAKL